MWKSIAGWVSHQVREECQRLKSEGIAAWAALLPAERVERIVAEEQGASTPCSLYTPLVALWTFLSQVLSFDHSCREAVAQLLAFMTGESHSRASVDTSPYCKGRQRLPEKVCSRLGREVGRELHDRVRDDQLLAGRPTFLIDGTTVSMPDTPANQAAYPQANTQLPGIGFPIARIVALISLTCGAVIDLAIAAYKGKGTGETSLFRQLWESFSPGDIVVGDRYFATFWDFAMLPPLGVDGVYRQHQLRITKHQRLRRLGPGDWLVRLPKPPRPDWMDEATYAALPDYCDVREVTLRIYVKGFRVDCLTVVTTLLDPLLVSAEELARVYRMRWHAELDLRALKSEMEMEVLRCKSPEMVRKEIWMHVLGYNLIRTVMADAAERAGCHPREISFKGAWQILKAFRPRLEAAAPAALPGIVETLLAAMGRERVGDRPNRHEPRAIKRRPKPHDLLTEPRHIAKARLAQ
jgi:hypothetical protein